MGVINFSVGITGTNFSAEIEEGASDCVLLLNEGYFLSRDCFFFADHNPILKIPFLESGFGSLTFLLRTDFFTYFLSFTPREGARGRYD